MNEQTAYAQTRKNTSNKATAGLERGMNNYGFRFILLSLCLVVIIADISPVAAVDFNFDDPVRITPFDWYRGKCWLSLDDDDRLILAYYEGWLVSSISNTYGCVWSPPVRIDGDQFLCHPTYNDFYAGKDRIFAAVYTQPISSELHSSVSVDGGESYYHPECHIQDQINPHTSSMAIATSNDCIICTWEDRGIEDGITIYSSYSLDDGHTWSNPDIRVDDSVGNTSPRRDPDLLVCSDGSYVCVWEDGRNNNGSKVYSSHTTDCGISWSPNVQVSSDNYTGYVFMPLLAMDNQSNVMYILFQNTIGAYLADLKLCRSYDCGITWEDTEVTINNDAGDIGVHNIVCTTDGVLVAVWNEDINYYGYQIFMSQSEDQGMTWSADTTISPDFEHEYVSRAAAPLPDGGFYVVFMLWNSKQNLYGLRARPVPTSTPTTAPGLPTHTPIPPTPTSTPTSPSDVWPTPTPTTAGTYTPSPTRTPTLSPATHTPVPPSPTFTPACPALSPDIALNQSMFTTDDRFLLTCAWCNPGFEITLDHYILLDVYGSFWFWPSWSETTDKTTRTILTGDDFHETILDFIWPETDPGEATGLKFWSAFLDPTTSAIIGVVDMVEWGYWG